MIDLLLSRYSLVERWWDAAGEIAIGEFFDHKRFKHSAFERCEPSSADEQVANWWRQSLGRQPGDAELKEQLAVTYFGHNFGSCKDGFQDTQCGKR